MEVDELGTGAAVEVVPMNKDRYAYKFDKPVNI
jgi:hypothetical protein